MVVLTGGEPFQQPELGNLVDSLCFAEGLDVQIETNGTLFLPLHFGMSNLHVVCSPKAPKIHPKLEPYVTAYKYLISAGEVAPDGLPTTCFGGMPGTPARPQNGKAEVYLQPVDTGDHIRNQSNLAAALASCFRHGYRLCLQLHKILGLE